jgi:hypothetical protein
MHKKLVKHIIKSKFNADLHISKLDPNLLFTSQSGLKYKHFLNNILSLPGAVNYLEIGLLEGGTITSALYKNNVNSAYGIEISKINNDIIIMNQKNFDVSFEFINEDCWTVNLDKIKDKINVYLFDGGHTYEDHYKSLEYYYPVLDDTFIFIVDDWLSENDQYYNDWKQVPDATRKAIKDLGLTIIYEQHLPRIQPQILNYWGGVWVAVLQKKKKNEK